MSAAISFLGNKTIPDLLFSYFDEVLNEQSEHLFVDGEGNSKNRDLTMSSSKVGKCPRQAVLDVLDPKEDSIESKMAKLSGLMAENVFQLFWPKIQRDFGTPYKLQYAGVDPNNPWAVCHIDTVFGDGKTLQESNKILIVEQKFTATIPGSPYSGWLSQGQWQGNVLKRDLGGNKKIAILFLATDFRSNMTDFNELFYPSDYLYNNALKKGARIIDFIKRKEVPGAEDCEPNFQLCGYCAHRHDCPAYAGSTDLPVNDELVQLVTSYAQVQADEREAATKRKKLRQQIVDFSGDKRFRQKVGEHSLSVYDQTAESIDEELLRNKYPEIWAKVIDNKVDKDLLKALHPDIAKEVIKKGKGSTAVAVRS